MRFRERDNRVTFTATGVGVWSYHDNSQDLNGTDYGWVLTDDATGSYESMSDRVIPDFKRRSSQGQVFNNPMTKTKWSRSYTPGNYSMEKIVEGGNPSEFRESRTNYFRPFVDINPEGEFGHMGHSIDVQNLATLAGVKALSNVAAPDIASLTVMAEARETIRFLRNPAEALVRLVKKHRAHKYDAGRRRRLGLAADTINQPLADFVGDNWLAYRYAYRPIVQDIQGGLDALFRLKENVPDRFTARGYASDTSSDSRDWSYLVHDFSKATQTDISVRAGVLYEQSSGYDPYGFGAAEIPMALWEAIPFSFVADWFVNVGSFIGALTPRTGVTRLATWSTTKTKQTTIFTGVQMRAVAGVTVLSSSPCQMSYETETLTRNPGVKLGLAYNPLPYPKDWFGGRRVADSLALANSILRSR